MLPLVENSFVKKKSFTRFALQSECCNFDQWEDLNLKGITWLLSSGIIKYSNWKPPCLGLARGSRRWCLKLLMWSKKSSILSYCLWKCWNYLSISLEPLLKKPKIYDQRSYFLAFQAEKSQNGPKTTDGQFQHYHRHG